MQFVLVRECRRVGNNISEENKNVCNVFPRHGATKTCISNSLIQVTAGNPTTHWSTSSIFDRTTDQQRRQISLLNYIVEVHLGNWNKTGKRRGGAHRRTQSQNETSHELPKLIYPSYLAVSAVVLVRSYRKLAPSCTPRLSNGKSGEKDTHFLLWFIRKRRGETDFGVRGRPAWAGRRRSTRRGSRGGSRRTWPRRRVHTCIVGGNRRGSGYW